MIFFTECWRACFFVFLCLAGCGYERTTARDLQAAIEHESVGELEQLLEADLSSEQAEIVPLSWMEHVIRLIAAPFFCVYRMYYTITAYYAFGKTPCRKTSTGSE